LESYRDRIRVLPMGLNLEPYLNPTAEDRGKTAELQARYAGPLWLACGRLIYYKGLHNAMRALPQVPGTLLVVGDGPERASLEAEAKTNGVEQRVVFIGDLPCRQIVPYYHAATAFWFPSNFKSEAFGLVQVEAMASGCPVINAQIEASGVSWVSRHDESGLTVPIDDPKSLATAARRLLEEPGLRKRLAQGGKERAVREFDCHVMAQRSLEVYQGILKN
jgi:rhamnosyl/mannosyltransferase